MNWFKNPLKPRRDRFVEHLIKQSESCVLGLEGLVEYCKNPTEANARAVREAEERGDEERRMLIDELNRTFVTPLDREDLFALSRAIDDILDYAWSTVDEMTLFRLDSTPHLTQMAELLRDAGKEMLLAMQRILEHPAVANEHAMRAKHCENRMEKVYREAIASLFTQKVDSIEGVLHLLKLREVYRHLSNAADRADAAANIVTDVIMKVM